jgi:hypothetical protein
MFTIITSRSSGKRDTVVLLHKGGFCNGSITKRRCFHKSRNVSIKNLVSQAPMIKDESCTKCNVFAMFEIILVFL